MVRGIDPESGRATAVEVQGGRIAAVRETRALPGLPLLAPGFLDIQVNGYREADYSLPDLQPEQVRAITESLAASGTTQHLPTIITSPPERILRNLGVIASAAARFPEVRAAVPGIHIEGPFISSQDGPRGAHDPAFVRPPDLEEVRRWQEAAEGRLRLLTLAPELDGALALIRELPSLGVIPAIGHTAAAPEVIREAVAAGARLSTHLGNGSHVKLPRLRNYLWEQLGQDGLSASIIADGFHLPDAVLRVFVRAKGLERLILISDVALYAGSGPGRYRRDDVEVEVFADGHLGLPGSEILAGAGFTLDHDLAHLVNVTGVSLAAALRLCTFNPARLLGLPPGFATLSAGAPANLVLFDHRPGQPRLHVRRTIREGVTVYSGE
jgi:N-acetylglucosamine-6-phosphate deacetylase